MHKKKNSLQIIIFFIFKGECGPGDDPMPFLCPTEKERLAFAAQNYDGKKSVWVPHKKEGFVKAEVQDTSGEKVTVKTAKGEVSYELWLYFPSQLINIQQISKN